MRDDVPDFFMNFAVVCANNGGCDHATCGGGPFLVVCVGLDSSMPRAHACFFSSETGEQSLQICIDYDRLSRGSFLDRPATLSGIEPLRGKHLGNVFVMTAEDGGLGLASLDHHELSLWARETGADGGAGWVQRRTIDLNALLPIDNPKRLPCLSGVAEGADVIFVSTEDGVFTIELKSLQAKKVSETGEVELIYPFVTFYTETLLQNLASGKLLGDQ